VLTSASAWTSSSPAGGYVFNQVHNIQPNVPAENIIAMLDAANEFGATA
jgi:uroporphyrinogen decarboxylase